MREYGSQEGDSPRTVTMRQALASGRPIPKVSMVVKLFRPGKYGGIGIITEASYKCTVGEASPLFSELLRMLGMLEETGVCLGVRIDNETRCAWTLVELDGTECVWEEHTWGYSVESTRPKKAAPKQTAAPAKERRQAGPAADEGEIAKWENPRSLV